MIAHSAWLEDKYYLIRYCNYGLPSSPKRLAAVFGLPALFGFIPSAAIVHLAIQQTNVLFCATISSAKFNWLTTKPFQKPPWQTKLDYPTDSDPDSHARIHVPPELSLADAIHWPLSNDAGCHPTHPSEIASHCIGHALGIINCPPWMRVRLRKALAARGFHVPVIGAAPRKTNAMGFGQHALLARHQARPVRTIRMRESEDCPRATCGDSRSYGHSQYATLKDLMMLC